MPQADDDFAPNYASTPLSACRFVSHAAIAAGAPAYRFGFRRADKAEARSARRPAGGVAPAGAA